MIYNMINTSMTIEKYADRNRLLKEAVSYIGQPKQSASEPDNLFLRLDPLSTSGEMLEFKAKDVLFAEKMETVSDKNGGTFQIFKIWVRIGCIGIKLEPFTV